MRFDYPKLKVHVWGGLGSQLYGWALMEKLKGRYPKRNVILVLHNSGITRRDEELSAFHSEESIQIKLDFNESRKLNILSQKTLVESIKQTIAVILNFLGFMARCNTEQEYLEIKPWVFSIRGHYTGLKISQESVQSILNTIKESNQPIYSQNHNSALGLHLRLGDLLTFESKSPIAMSRLNTGLKMGTRGRKISSYLIYSDSPHEAESLVCENFPDLQYQIRKTNPLQTILDLANVGIFIGSPSKISEWIAIIRCHTLVRPLVFLPNEMKKQMETMLDVNSKIQYY